MYSSKFRNPTNDVELMGELHNLGTAFAIMTVALFGPDHPTEISQHMERVRIFLGAAKYAKLILKPFSNTMITKKG